MKRTSYIICLIAWLVLITQVPFALGLDVLHYHRVPEQFDFYGARTGYQYGAATSGDPNNPGRINGVLTEEVNALNQKTTYGYTLPPVPQYSSFSDMFSDYINRRELKSDIGQNCYLTGAQTQPSSITQGGQTTTIGYDLNPNSPSAFQPTASDLH